MSVPESPGTSYDEVPYPDFVHPKTSPDCIHAIARLLGMPPTDVTRGRVLELACGQGGNLISLASCFPNGEFLGIDLSARHIEAGRNRIERLGLTNIKLETLSITDLPDDVGEFATIVAQGVYSWVPDDVREAILAICREHLAPHGVAFIGYNTYPGWHQKQMVREMMQHHTLGIENARERVAVAKELLDSLVATVPETSAYGLALREESQSLQRSNEDYVFHEQFEAVNQPRYFHQFASELEAHDLQFICETELANFQLQHLPPPIVQQLHGMSKLQREQHLDYLKRRTFRQSLICHRDVQLSDLPEPSVLTTLRISNESRCEAGSESVQGNAPIQFRGTGGMGATLNQPVTKAAMLHLSEAWPCNETFDDLLLHAKKRLGQENASVVAPSTLTESEQLLSDLFSLALAGLLDLHTAPGSFVSHVSEMPHASELARLQAEAGHIVTTRRHQSVRLDETARQLVRLADGQSSRDDMLEGLLTFIEQQGVVMKHEDNDVTDPAMIRQIIDERLDANLIHLAKLALLVG